MSRKNNKGRISGPFVPMLKHTIKQPAWIALSHGARSLYVALKSHYNSTLGNAVYLSARGAAKEIGSNKDYVTRWFRELQFYGFTAMVTPGHLGVEGRGKAPHWRLTEEWFAGKPPTRDYLNWNGEKFQEQKSPKYYLRKKQNPVPQTGDTLSLKLGTVVSPKLGTPHGTSVPQTGDIQPHATVPQTGDITSLTTRSLAERSGEQSAKAQGNAKAPLPAGDDAKPQIEQTPAPPTIDDDLPTFLRRGHPDCPFK
jgi:hypothetical protein